MLVLEKKIKIAKYSSKLVFVFKGLGETYTLDFMR